MIPFSIAFFATTTIFLIAAIYFIVVCIKTKKAKEKISGKIVSALISTLSFLSIALTPIPKPTIYPLPNDVKIYDGIIKIEIDSNDSSPFIHTYYSVDGSDPEGGYVYESPFTITSSTTVYAKNKFLYRWSEPSKSTYRFENIQNTYVSAANDSQMSLEEIFAYIITFFIMASICLSLIRK